MANSFTANLNLEKPEVGADSNLWGGHINSDLDVLDSIFTTATTRPIASQILSSTRILDSATTTKSILLVLSGITTTTGRNLTVQDADGTLAYTAQIATSTAASATTGQIAAATATLVALLAASAFTSTAVTGVTTTAGDNSTKFATTAYADRVGVQQRVTTETGAFATGSTAMPYDDTIPQSTEGDQYMSLAITPRSATSKLTIEVVFNYAVSTSAGTVIALFQDSTANALMAVPGPISSQGVQSVSFSHTMTSGTTSSTTFKVRAGSNDASAIYFNGLSAARLLGGVMGSSITITEVGF
jgi:hypothetical protein